MAATSTSPDTELLKHLRALVLLNLRPRAEGEGLRDEVLLNQAGFSPVEIGAMLGKKPNTVSKAIARAKAAPVAADE